MFRPLRLAHLKFEQRLGDSGSGSSLWSKTVTQERLVLTPLQMPLRQQPKNSEACLRSYVNVSLRTNAAKGMWLRRDDVLQLRFHLHCCKARRIPSATQRFDQQHA